MRNANGSVISDRVFNGSSIVTDTYDNLFWRHWFLRVGPLNEAYNQSSYQCIITIGNQSVTSNIGTLTVAGEYLKETLF